MRQPLPQRHIMTYFVRVTFLPRVAMPRGPLEQN